MELTATQRQTLEQWFGALQKRDAELNFAIDLVRTIAGDKPACSLKRSTLTVSGGPFVYAPDDGIQFMHDLGFVTMKRGNSWYVARSRDRFGLLESSDPALGRFFGYPTEAIEWFINASSDERVDSRERAESGDFEPEELAYVDFLPYQHETSIEGYERAIEEGKRIRQRIGELSDTWDIPVLDTIARDHYNLFVSIYSGEREHLPGEEIGFKMVCKNPAID